MALSLFMPVVPALGTVIPLFVLPLATKPAVDGGAGFFGTAAPELEPACASASVLESASAEANAIVLTFMLVSFRAPMRRWDKLSLEVITAISMIERRSSVQLRSSFSWRPLAGLVGHVKSPA
jgi:hypothetical protein